MRKILLISLLLLLALAVLARCHYKDSMTDTGESPTTHLFFDQKGEDCVYTYINLAEKEIDPDTGEVDTVPVSYTETYPNTDCDILQDSFIEKAPIKE